jgi:intracellular septation protein A
MSGVIIGYLGQEYVYLINGVTFLAVILALILLGPVPQSRAQVERGMRAAWTDIFDGVKFILNQPLILSTMILDFIATFFASANTLLPFFAQNILHIGEVAYGWLAAAQSIGAVLVGIIASQYHHIRRQGMLLVTSVVVFGGATILFGVSRIYAVIFLALALMGAADSVSTIIRNTIRQLNTPDSLRGRMTSINQIFFMGGPQLFRSGRRFPDITGMNRPSNLQLPIDRNLTISVRFEFLGTLTLTTRLKKCYTNAIEVNVLCEQIPT